MVAENQTAERGGTPVSTTTHDVTPALSSCPACFKTWQDQAEMNLRTAQAFEDLALRIVELNEAVSDLYAIHDTEEKTE